MPPRTPPPELSLAEHVCLALVVQRVSHGWAIGSLLAPTGEVGRVWSLSRPLTYRAVETLCTKGLVDRRGPAERHGRERALLTATAAGRRAGAAWLDAPVEHLRDVRTELLVKLVLRARAGLDAAPLLAAQEAAFAPVIDALIGGAGGDVVDVWRREHARAVRRFLAEAQRVARGAPVAAPGRDLRLSARNQLPARVLAVRRGQLLASVKATVVDGGTVTAMITEEACDDLDLAAGDDVVLVVKATEVMVAKPAAPEAASGPLDPSR